MPAKKKKLATAERVTKARPNHSSGDASVEEFLAKFDTLIRRDYELVRKIILGVSPKISAGIKWNSLSFRTTEWFATINWRAKDTVQLVFHLGAKVKDNSTKGMTIADPAGLLKWLAKDRCLVTLGNGKDVAKNRKPFEKLVKAWITYVGAVK